MGTLLGFITTSCFILAIVGIFSPKTSLFWYGGERTRKLSLLIYGAVFFVSIIFMVAFAPKSNLPNSQTQLLPIKTSPKIEILQHSMTVEKYSGMITIHCRTRNNTNSLVTYMDIKATFFDKNGKIVGTGLGNSVNLASGAEKTIDVMAMGIENADKYEVLVDNVIYQ